MKFLSKDAQIEQRIRIEFTDPPVYTISSCTESIYFSMPGGRDKVWTFFKTDAMLSCTCEGSTIFNLTLADEDGRCASQWVKDTDRIKIEGGTADSFRTMPTGQ